MPRSGPAARSPRCAGSTYEAAGARLAAWACALRGYLPDRTLSLYPAEIALVEDVRGGTLEQWLERGDPGAQQSGATR